jgi:hypothetical protein
MPPYKTVDGLAQGFLVGIRKTVSQTEAHRFTVNLQPGKPERGPVPHLIVVVFRKAHKRLDSGMMSSDPPLDPNKRAVECVRRRVADKGSFMTESCRIPGSAAWSYWKPRAITMESMSSGSDAVSSLPGLPALLP